MATYTVRMKTEHRYYDQEYETTDSFIVDEAAGTVTIVPDASKTHAVFCLSLDTLKQFAADALNKEPWRQAMTAVERDELLSIAMSHDRIHINVRGVPRSARTPRAGTHLNRKDIDLLDDTINMLLESIRR